MRTLLALTLGLLFLSGCSTNDATGTATGGQQCSSCLVGSPYCFDLEYDTSNCGSCGHACAHGEVCNAGKCAAAACGLDGGCAGDAVCCGDVCCAAPDFCCQTPTGMVCQSGNGESQCPSNGCTCN